MKIPNLILHLKIYRKIFLILPLLLIIQLCQYPPSFASDSGYSRYSNRVFDTDALNGAELRKEADEYFVKAFDSPTEDEQIKNYQLAMQKYFLLSKAEPYNYYPYVQMARIHDERGEEKLAKKNYFHALNLDKNNPYTNFYFGEYHVKRNRYERGLKYYLIAYNNGYKDNYVTNLKLAHLYEKLGDLKKSEELYVKLNELNPGDSEIQEKIQSFEMLDYEQSGYYHSIRE